MSLQAVPFYLFRKVPNRVRNMIYVELLIYVGKPFGGVNDQTAIMEEIQKLLVSRFIIQS